MKSAFFFERTTAPSWSSKCSRKTSTSSPSLSEWASLNSSIATAPSDLKPTSRMTAVSVTRSTFDLTISPSSMLERVPSYSAVIFSISSGEYSSCRSGRTRRREWGGGVSGFDSGRSSVSTSIQYRFGCGFGVALARAMARGRRNLAGQALPRQRHDLSHLLLEPEPGGVENHRVCGSLEGSHAPRGIGSIARRQHVRFTPDLDRVRRATSAPFGQAAPRPLLGAGRQKHLERSIGKDHRPDVPSVYHHTPGMAQHGLPLLHIHPVSHLGNGGHRGNALRDSLGAYRLRHIDSRHLGAVDVVHQDQPHGEILRQGDNLLGGP